MQNTRASKEAEYGRLKMQVDELDGILGNYMQKYKTQTVTNDVHQKDPVPEATLEPLPAGPSVPSKVAVAAARKAQAERRRGFFIISQPQPKKKEECKGNLLHYPALIQADKKSKAKRRRLWLDHQGDPARDQPLFTVLKLQDLRYWEATRAESFGVANSFLFQPLTQWPSSS
ncbi:unnamed protein product [Symbiodinium sp. KB8]|nr:unnamed protein product [Symbiodinium sp. KB8]